MVLVYDMSHILAETTARKLNFMYMKKSLMVGIRSIYYASCNRKCTRNM